ncbi:uncharacterized protein DS421_15g515930 [Arachis hypogaea]|nr:uncharacterized protein DS421_15g515930 [Arachis hypogaea]
MHIRHGSREISRVHDHTERGRSQPVQVRNHPQNDEPWVYQRCTTAYREAHSSISVPRSIS